MPSSIALPPDPTPVDLLALGRAFTLEQIEAAGHRPAYAGAGRMADALLDEAARVLAPLGIAPVALQALLGERVAEAGLAVFMAKLARERQARRATVTRDIPGPPALRLVSTLDQPDLPPPVPGPPLNPAGLGAHRIELRSGRTLRFEHYCQYRTYSGVLCGYPKRSDVRREIERHLRHAGAGSTGPQPVLLVPRMTAYAYPPEGGIEDDPCEALPPVTTVARFESRPVGDGDASWVQVVWFQHAWGLPPAEVLDDLRVIDWERHATDESW